LFFAFSVHFLFLDLFCLAEVFACKRFAESHDVFVELTRVYHPFVVLVIDVFPIVGKILIAELAVFAIGWLVLRCLKL
jgi:hypothetical protein